MQYQQKELFLPPVDVTAHPEAEKQQKIADHQAWIEAERERRAVEERLNKQLRIGEYLGEQVIADVIEFPIQQMTAKQVTQKKAA